MSTLQDQWTLCYCLLPFSSSVAQKVVAMRKKQQLSIGPCKSLPNSPSHSSVPAASIPSVHINQVRLNSSEMARCVTSCSCRCCNIEKSLMLISKEVLVYVTSWKSQITTSNPQFPELTGLFIVFIPFALLTLWLSYLFSSDSAGSS